MFYLVETEEQLKELSYKGYKKAYCEIIPLSNHLHPHQDNISCIYLHPLDSHKGYIIPINHGEAFQIPLSKVIELLNSFNNLYVISLKETWHFIFNRAFTPISPLPPTYIRNLTKTHNYFYKKYPKQKDINAIIPISKHYEMCENNFRELKEYIRTPHNLKFLLKSNWVFNLIESNGIKIDKNEFNKYFQQDVEDYVYTQYNLNTTTLRPSNKFNNINYAALNKKNGERQSFIPRNDIFLELDISAYHPTLLGKLVGYRFPNRDIHQSFAEMYKVDYKKAKEITFKQIYGGIWDEYKDLEFFKLVQEYTDNIWEKYNKEGYIECPISKHRFEKDKLENMNPQKLLNYTLQNLETSNNIRILWEILKVLEGCKTKLVLYVYDSFLFDFDKSEENKMKEITKIFESKNLGFSMTKGTTYDFE